MKLVIRCVIYLAIVFAAAYFLCDIKPETEYGWLSAFWHGMFLIPNCILHLFNKNILFFSTMPTTAYKIFFVLGLMSLSLIRDIIEIVSEALKKE